MGHQVCGRTEGGVGAGTLRQHLRRALCATRTNAQSWASGLAAVKKTERSWKKGLQWAPRPEKWTAARAGDAAEARGITWNYEANDVDDFSSVIYKANDVAIIRSE
ncbi:hypothetical protein NDU88_006617 [Pleurodeles waltl]|uniref:Uncharacterized protein n=1 Tax=Pleurodeles waltl TaxID=8319 RepID=A0AAV7MCR6_PLEWA|nr:hypothetical protein NDU88_006617 [Pleurodeles waltl]